MATRRRTQKLVLTPVTPEFRTACHDLLDKTLNDHPGTHALLLVVAGDIAVNCASLPNTVTFKRGCIDTLYEALHPESENPFS